MNLPGAFEMNVLKRLMMLVTFTTWSLIDRSDDVTFIATGPSDGEDYDTKTLYRFTWILKRCNSYIFEIFDSWGDGFASPGSATLTFDSGRGNATVGTIEGNFGTEDNIDNICSDDD